jgi:hypothetical protein
MIRDSEFDEMRLEAQLRLRLLRDEIKAFRKGNREDALEGVRNAARQGFENDIGEDGQGPIPSPAGIGPGSSGPTPPTPTTPAPDTPIA